MSKIVKLIFVRHGESGKNVLGVKSRAHDKFPLTEKGEKQVEGLSDKIEEHIDLIISSPVLRCRQTAEILNKQFGVEISYDCLIEEYDSGEWDELSREELLKNEDKINYDKVKVDFEARYNYRLGRTGEIREEIVERVGRFIREIVRNYLGSTLLVVGHGGINAAMIKFLSDISFEDFFRYDEIGHEEIEILFIDGAGKLLKIEEK